MYVCVCTPWLHQTEVAGLAKQSRRPPPLFMWDSYEGGGGGGGLKEEEGGRLGCLDACTFIYAHIHTHTRVANSMLHIMPGLPIKT